MTRFAFAIPALLIACANPVKDKPKAEVNEAKPEAAKTEPAPGAAKEEKLALDAASKLEFVGAKVTRNHDGGFKTFTGNITLVEGDAEKSSITIDVDTASLYADDEKLTGHLKSPDFFDVAKFPKAMFTSTGIKKKDGSTYEVTGNLDLHGVKKSITFPATIDVAAGEVSAKAEFGINRKDFSINYPGMADDLIKDDVLIKFDIKAKRG
jgi:polyisoprenoid-binding protein YceI